MKWFALFFLLLLIPLSSAVSLDEEHITLLSVIEYGNDSRRGGTADFTLQVQSGSGKIFLESYPAAQIDMQVATRLANEYACEYTDVNCDDYDFFYTVRSGSPIIGGSSGGAAATMLTLSILLDQQLPENLAMTGAITSGGIITPVSGVNEKILAAQQEQKTLILIPQLSLASSITLNDSNLTNTSLFDELITDEQLLSYADGVTPVLTIADAWFQATGDELNLLPPLQEPPQFYTDTMRETAQLLCDRSQALFAQIPSNQTNSSSYVSAQDFYNSSLDAGENYYSKASYCFSANLPLQELLVEQYSPGVINGNANRLMFTMQEYRDQVDSLQLVSFTDLETYGIVKERLLEAEEVLEEGLQTDNVTAPQLAYAIERYESALAWSRFFGTDTRRVQLDEESIQRACFQELQAVETRMSYLSSIFPESFLTSIRTQLDGAYEYVEEDEHALCLFKASKAKAHANLFFTTLSLADSQVPFVIDAKHQAAYSVLAEQAPQFPLLGYSYTEYSAALKDESPFSALLFAEYGLVFSDVSGYFPAQEENIFSQFFNRRDQLAYFSIGGIAGMMLMLLLLFIFRKKP